jgi:Mg-chelatase subunit ChlD
MKRLLALALVLGCAGGSGCARDSVLTQPPAAGSGSAGEAEAGDGGSGAGGSSAGRGGSPVLDVDAIRESGCARFQTQTETLPANILFVIDRSGSMTCNPPPTTDSETCENTFMRTSLNEPTKWEIIQRALVDSLALVPPSSRIGVSYFSNDDQCGVFPDPNVPIARSSAAQREVIESSLLNVRPGGATPLVGATILAYQHIQREAVADQLRGNKFVVLLTDGKQSDECSYPSRCTDADSCTRLLIESEVPKAAGEGASIRTFVLGVPGSELDRRTLSQIAFAGGTARPNCDPELDCHYDVTRGDFSAELELAFRDILQQTRTCDIPAPPEQLGNLSEVNLLYRSTGDEVVRLVPQDMSAECDAGARGWQPVEGGGSIRLCGAFCDLIKADPGLELELVIGCPVQGPQ